MFGVQRLCRAASGQNLWYARPEETAVNDFDFSARPPFSSQQLLSTCICGDKLFNFEARLQLSTARCLTRCSGVPLNIVVYIRCRRLSASSPLEYASYSLRSCFCNSGSLQILSPTLLHSNQHILHEPIRAAVGSAGQLRPFGLRCPSFPRYIRVASGRGDVHVHQLQDHHPQLHHRRSRGSHGVHGHH